MAIERDLVDLVSLQGLFVGADASVIYKHYEVDGVTPKTMLGQTIVLDIRNKDLSPDPALLSVTGVVSGTFNVDPLTNAEICTFTISAAALAKTIFTGDDTARRYSIKRTNSGAGTIYAFGDAIITRVTQA